MARWTAQILKYRKIFFLLILSAHQYFDGW
jgi:hypothetical protein